MSAIDTIAAERAWVRQCAYDQVMTCRAGLRCSCSTCRACRVILRDVPGEMPTAVTPGAVPRRGTP